MKSLSRIFIILDGKFLGKSMRYGIFIPKVITVSNKIDEFKKFKK